MKSLKLATFALLISVAPAFGISTMSVGDFEMSGTWSSSDGSKGMWTADMKVTDGAVDHTYEVEETLKLKLPDGSEMIETNKWTAVSDDSASGFFDMLKGRSTYGWGLCDKDQCKIQSSVGDRFSEVYSFSRTGITVTGMKEEGNVKVAWRGKVTKK